MKQIDDALGGRLRRDADRWVLPSEAARARLRARLADAPAPGRRTLYRLALALALAAALLLAALTLRTPPAAGPPQPSLGLATLEAQAMRPLRTELAGLRRDGSLLARGVWRRVPEPVRRLLDAERYSIRSNSR